MAKMTDAPKVSVAAHARAMPFKSMAPATGSKVMVNPKKDEPETKDVKAKGGLGGWSSFSVDQSDNGGFTVRVSPKSKSGMLGDSYAPPTTHSYSTVEELDEYLDSLLGHQD